MHSALKNSNQKKETNFHKKQLDILYQICQRISSFYNLDELLDKIYELLGKTIPAEAFYVALYQEQAKYLDYVFVMDENERYPRITEPLGSGIAAQAIIKKKTILLNRTEEEIKAIESKTLKAFGNKARIPKSIIVSPILMRDKVEGVISTQSYEWKAYNSEDAEFLSIIAAYIGLVLVNLHLEKLQSTIALASTISHEFNQPLTGVTGYCNLIKEDMNEEHPFFKDIVEVEKQAVRLEELVKKFQKIVSIDTEISPSQNSNQAHLN